MTFPSRLKFRLPSRVLLATVSVLAAMQAGCLPGNNRASNISRASLHENIRTPSPIWVDRDTITNGPVQGPAWDRLRKAAAAPMPQPDLSDQHNQANIMTLAKALVYARTGDEKYRVEVITACMLAMHTERDGDTLALGKQLLAYVLAADLVGLPDSEDRRFRAWLRRLLDYQFPSGKTLRSTHETRPNNWGTLAGASRLATAIYLDDKTEVMRCAEIFKGWLGDRDIYAGFRFKNRSWQADPRHPVGINPAGAVKKGHAIDGVLPDDQRRGGTFRWPPPGENYVYTALQGAVAQAVLLGRCGYQPWQWEDKALLRAFKWLYETAEYPAQGDDVWMIYILNDAYNASFPTPPTAPKPGKIVAWADWTHAGQKQGAPPPSNDKEGKW